MSDIDASMVKLTTRESEMLLAMASRHRQELSYLLDRPNARTVQALVRKGMATDIMGTFWRITPAGQQRVALLLPSPSADA
ncbi:hypothetical protein APB26_32725 [Pseudomonas aeruginosa]|uniref:hypothetical protein n=1 Tax=Pseudomonas aeruginosa TaxID=287 RepID=UPI00071BE5D8|nr:hypothetical protein [Pseudomonas aeruginosa]KSQ21748.1 hypothetical protein APB26_32725 [Pseudomonas aeruginosa]RPV61421.1 hypothetical protein IPC838_19065 [Pseudomonas aeruginosa]